MIIRTSTTKILTKKMGKNLRYFSKEDNTNVQLYEDYREMAVISNQGS